MKSFTKACASAVLMMTLGACAHHETVAQNQTAPGFPMLERTPANDTGLAMASMSVGDQVKLSRCGGLATVSRLDSGDIRVQISDSTCATLETNQTSIHMLGPNAHHGGYVDIKADAERVQEVDVRSKSGESVDLFLVRVVPPPKKQKVVYVSYPYDNGEVVQLDSCNGTAVIKYQNNQLNVVISHVANCQAFDILSNVGAQLNFNAKPLQTEGYQTYGASFTVPSYLIQTGFNAFIMRVYSFDGTAHEDRFRVVLNKDGYGQ